MASRSGAGGNDPYARELARQAKEQEKARKAAETEAKRKAREEKAAYETARAQEAIDRTYVVENDVEQLPSLLWTAVLDGNALAFDRLKQQFTPTPYLPPPSHHAVSSAHSVSGARGTTPKSMPPVSGWTEHCVTTHGTRRSGPRS